ncbi:hypothetical protein FYM52_14980 [Comamonas sp. CAH-2]|nr:hypothetical protein [Comamonas sp. CAH-2]MRT21641.1 hypothetical protein [Comamonas sp. CAH-2]
MRQEIHQTNEVFTPSKPAKKTFIERETVREKLVRALMTPGKQIVVFGHSGVGKSTLLQNKLLQTYEHHITTRCMRGMKFDQIIFDAFSQLDSYYISEKTQKNEIGFKISVEPPKLFTDIKSQFEIHRKSEGQNKLTPIIPPQLTPPTLGKLIGESNACWVIEDFHKIEDGEKHYLSQLMKVFMDLSDDYPSLKIIAIGATNTARQVIDYDPEMKHRVSEIHVPLMTAEEIKSIVVKGEALLNIGFPELFKNLIVQHSAGMASVAHTLCLNICYSANVLETAPSSIKITKKNWDEALLSYIEESSDNIQSSFEKALNQKRKSKFHHEKIIIQALCDFKNGEAGRLDLLQKIQREFPEYPNTGFKQRLEKLSLPEKGRILKFNENSGTFSFYDPIYHAYALAHRRAIFESKENSSISPEVTAFLEALEELLSKNKPAEVE